MFSIVVFFALESYKGWPTNDKPPEDFFILSVVIQEPVGGDFDGSIYMWTKEAGEVDDSFEFFYKGDINSPRSFSTPYTKEKHKLFQSIKERLMRGESVRGSSLKKGKGGEKGKKGGKGEGREGRGGMGSFSFSKEYDIEFHNLPPGAPPEKILGR
jgi:hypothetical protein